MSIKPLGYYINNKTNLSHHEYRTINRYHLHPNNQRLCSVCFEIYDDYKSFFHIKKYYKDGTTGYSNMCKFCSSKYNLEKRIRYRKDPRTYIKHSLTTYKNRAKTVNVPFNLSVNYLHDLFLSQKQQCFYTGQSLSFEHVKESRTSPHPLLASLDRKNPKLGYVEGNVVWCTYYINRMKNESTYEEFIETCKVILSIHTI